MGRYNHLTIFERESILLEYNQGKPIREIARILNRNPATISRELKRNTCKRKHYSAVLAQSQYRQRRKNCVRPCVLDQPSIYDKVVELLNRYWSPEQINSRLKLENSHIQIGSATIYRGLASGKLAAPLRQKLRHKGQRHKDFLGCGHLPVSHSIHERPEEANNRSRIGDWECDTVRGAKDSGCVATLVDRMSRYTLLAKLPNRTATEYTQAAIEVFKRIPSTCVLTLTCDHGKEFAKHKKLAKELDCTVYFADPGCPGQRGTNENTNGLIRQFMPKRTSFRAISQNDVDAFADLLNFRPRKCLNWNTPQEIFFHQVLHLT